MQGDRGQPGIPPLTTPSRRRCSAGRRMCIGKHFALLEAKVVLAMVLQAFDVRPSPKYQHYIRMAGSLRPDKGLPLQFSLRRA